MSTLRFFSYAMPGAVQDNNTAGSLADFLEQCLVTGMPSQTVTITNDGTDVFVDYGVTNHGILLSAVLTISGATQPEYNGEFVAEYVSATVVKFPLVGTAVSPATGTISSTVGSAGWTKPFSDANYSCFKQGAGSNSFFIRVGRNHTNGIAPIAAYENMTGTTAGVNNFAGTNWYHASNATNQQWYVIADEKGFYLYTYYTAYGYGQFSYFTDIENIDPVDAFGTYINTPPDYVGRYGALIQANSTSAWFRMARSYTGNVGGVTAYIKGTYEQGDYIGQGKLTYPSPVDGSVYMDKVSVIQGGTVYRGKLPYLYAPYHNNPFAHLSYFKGQGVFAGKKFITFGVGPAASTRPTLELP